MNLDVTVTVFSSPRNTLPSDPCERLAADDTEPATAVITKHKKHKTPVR